MGTRPHPAGRRPSQEPLLSWLPSREGSVSDGTYWHIGRLPGDQIVFSDDALPLGGTQGGRSCCPEVSLIEAAAAHPTISAEVAPGKDSGVFSGILFTLFKTGLISEDSLDSLKSRKGAQPVSAAPTSPRGPLSGTTGDDERPPLVCGYELTPARSHRLRSHLSRCRDLAQDPIGPMCPEAPRGCGSTSLSLCLVTWTR